MKTIALFNNKGGVGKTSLAYHLGYMFAELGHRTLFADLDPQANLSSACLTEDRLEAIWKLKPRPRFSGRSNDSREASVMSRRSPLSP
jgi:chromosome partitioning protein